MKQQDNPKQPVNPGQPNRPANEQNEKLSTNNPPPQNDNRSENDDYRRDGAQLGGSASDPQPENISAGTQKGGGGSGYDVSREQQEVNRQQEEMQQERDLDQVHPERTQNPQPEINPGRENPDKNPSQPDSHPGTNTTSSFDRNAQGGWSQSSWDANTIR